MIKLKINTESIASAMFLLGYDRIDSYLFTAIQGSLSILANEMNVRSVNFNEKQCDVAIEFIQDEEFKNPFSKCVDVDFGISMKEEVNFNTNVAPLMGIDGMEYSFIECIGGLDNRLLAEYIKQYIDLDRIIIEKINVYSKENIDYFPTLFCSKEKETLSRIFGIENRLINIESKGSKLIKTQ